MGFKGNGAPGETRTPDPLLRSYAVQNSKCRFWCRLRGSASFISPLNWTEVGPNPCVVLSPLYRLVFALPDGHTRGGRAAEENIAHVDLCTGARRRSGIESEAERIEQV